ncbi:hypothetical protein KFK09_014554 [Dendrobium nobile]|uniref:Mitochondrial protein n=1 Tax=Dendrobium nobile TaxID=94219 RepID=A0A8T3B2H6_DENNO|nr:hypothetical protein KFK09_014554 [Dendrobium nobile]
MHEPTIQHFQALKRLLRYIKGTLHFRLPITIGDLQLRTYLDIDCATDSKDRKSDSGFCSFLGSTLITWSVKKHVIVAKSSTEEENLSLSSASSDILWLHRLLAEFQIQ